MLEGIELAKACAQVADEMKAEDIRVLDVSEISTLTDYMIVCSGTSMPHLKAIIRDIAGVIGKRHEAKPHSEEGNADARWVVLDYIDVMIHVMLTDMRELYALEDLWSEAKEVEWSAEA